MEETQSGRKPQSVEEKQTDWNEKQSGRKPQSVGGRLWEWRKSRQTGRKEKLILKKLKHWKGFKSMKEILVYHPEKIKIKF